LHFTKAKFVASPETIFQIGPLCFLVRAHIRAPALDQDDDWSMASLAQPARLVSSTHCRRPALANETTVSVSGDCNVVLVLDHVVECNVVNLLLVGSVCIPVMANGFAVPCFQGRLLSAPRAPLGVISITPCDSIRCEDAFSDTGLATAIPFRSIMNQNSRSSQRVWHVCPDSDVEWRLSIAAVIVVSLWPLCPLDRTGVRS
jgi:hypothetical protein